jgi:hypothetical protein
MRNGPLDSLSTDGRGAEASSFAFFLVLKRFMVEDFTFDVSGMRKVGAEGLGQVFGGVDNGSAKMMLSGLLHH